MIKNLNFKKLIATVVLTTFTYTFILHESVYGIISTINESSKIKEVISKIDSFVLPYRLGRVVDEYNNGSEVAVVLIQDLHCHPEVQKNIYDIINLFNTKFNLRKVFIEGAPKGKFSPVLLTTIPDEKIKKSAVDRLFNKGLLSAAEYFEVIHNTGKVYGIEDWSVYLENYNRLKKLLTLKQQILPKVEQLTKSVKELQDKYLSKEIKVFARKLDRIMKEDKFYKIDLIAKSLNISLDFYPEIKKYIELVNISNTLKLKRIGYELKEFFTRLQKVLPYGVYTRLQQKLQDQKNIDEYYLALIKVAESYGEDLLKQYPNLVKFFNYIKLNYRINPTLLAQEERLLKHEILVRYARKIIDKEILKLVLNTQSLKDLVNLTIVPEEYKYFVKNKEEYSLLIRKYFSEDFVEILNILDEKDLYKFYEVNINRNHIFYKNLLDSLITELKLAGQNITTNPQIQTTNLKFESKYLYMFITGGFHSQITDYFKQLGVSYLVIMPNATKYYGDRIYEKLALGETELTDFLGSAFGIVLSAMLQEGEKGSIETILNAIIPQDIKEIRIEQVQRLLKEWAKKLEDEEIKSKLIKGGVKEEVISAVAESLEKTDIQKINDNKYLVRINDKSYEIEVDKSGNIKNVKNLTEKLQRRNNISLWNRIVSAVITVSIPVVISAGITYILGHGMIGGPFGFILGLLGAGRFIRQIIYFAKASRVRGEPVEFEKIKGGLAKFFPPELILRIKEGKANNFTPAYTDGKNIYINTEVFSKLDTFEQYSIIRHELRHIVFLENHKFLAKIPFLSELYVTFVEIFINFLGIILAAIFPGRVIFLESNIKLLEEETKFLATQLVTDSHTRVLNRIGFDQEFRRIIEIANRVGYPVSVLVFDVDNFKRINDTYGHEKGDEVLRKIAKVVKESLRSTDIIARFGGEEFVVILPATNQENGIKIAEKVRKEIEENISKNNKFLPVEGNLIRDKENILRRKDNNQPVGTLSIGVVSLEHTKGFLIGESIESIKESILENADDALYLAKTNRNKVELYQEEKKDEIQRIKFGIEGLIKGYFGEEISNNSLEIFAKYIIERKYDFVHLSRFLDNLIKGNIENAEEKKRKILSGNESEVKEIAEEIYLRKIVEDTYKNILRSRNTKTKKGDIEFYLNKKYSLQIENILIKRIQQAKIQNIEEYLHMVEHGKIILPGVSVTPKKTSSTFISSVVLGMLGSIFYSLFTAGKTFAAEIVTKGSQIVGITQKGDSLWEIAKQFLQHNGVVNPTNTEIAKTVNEIIKLNADKLNNPKIIYPGQEFLLKIIQQTPQQITDAGKQVVQQFPQVVQHQTNIIDTISTFFTNLYNSAVEAWNSIIAYLQQNNEYIIVAFVVISVSILSYVGIKYIIRAYKSRIQNLTSKILKELKIWYYLSGLSEIFNLNNWKIKLNKELVALVIYIFSIFSPLFSSHAIGQTLPISNEVKVENLLEQQKLPQKLTRDTATTTTLLSRIYKDTGLIESYKTTGTDSLHNQSFTYDNALAIIIALNEGRFDIADKILKFYKNQDTIYTSYDVETGQPRELYVKSGELAWLGIAAAHYENVTGDTTYRDLMIRIAQQLINYQQPDGRILGGEGFHWTSTEHNIDAYVFFKMVYQLTKIEKYKTAANKVKGWLLNVAYNKNETRFNRGHNDVNFATDTHSWGILALLNDISKEELIKLVEFVENNAAVRDESGNIIGFDFTYSKGREVISYEWTMQMALVYKILGMHEKAKVLIDNAKKIIESKGGLPYASKTIETTHGWVATTNISVAAEAWYYFAKFKINPFELLSKELTQIGHKPETKISEITGSIKIHNIEKFEIEQKRKENWEKIVERLYIQQNTYAMIVDETDLTVLKMFNSFDELVNFIESDDFKEIKEIKEIGVPKAYWFENGTLKEGLFFAGPKLTQQKYELSQAYLKHKELEKICYEILREVSSEKQQEIIKKYNLNITDKTKQGLVVALKIKTDENGNYREIVDAYTEDNFYVKDNKLFISGQEIKFYIYNEKGELVEIKDYDKIKHDIQPIIKTLDGSIILFGKNKLIKNIGDAKISQIVTTIQKQNAQKLSERIKRSKIVETVITAINIGGVILNIPITPIVTSIIRIADLTTQPKYTFPTSVKLIETAKQALGEEFKNKTLEEVREYLSQIKPQELEKVLKFYREQEKDAEIQYFLSFISVIANTMLDTNVVSRDEAEGKILKEIFASPYFNIATGEIDIKSILGHFFAKEIIYGRGASLNELIKYYDKIPLQHWLQFFSVNVNVRSLLNSLFGKNIDKQVPHAPSLKSLSAYEIRLFGFPILIFYKEKLAEKVKIGYEKYAFIFKEGFPDKIEYIETKEEFEEKFKNQEIHIIGYTGVRDEKSGKIYNPQPIFATNDGGIIVFGEKAAKDLVEKVKKELEDFLKYEELLDKGGVLLQEISDDGKVIKTEFLLGEDKIKEYHVKREKLKENNNLINEDRVNFSWYSFIENNKKFKVVFVYPLDSIYKATEETKEKHRIMTEIAKGYEEGAVVILDKSGNLKEIKLGMSNVDEVIEIIGELPIIEQNRIIRNKFNNILIDIDNDGEKEIVNLIFPLGKEIVKERFNPITKQNEKLKFKNGQLTEIVTPTTITLLRYENGIEKESKIYINNGDIDNPQQGRLIERTQTIEYYHYGPEDEVKKDSPIIVKKVYNNINDETYVETYGIFPLPIKRVSKETITEIEFDETGLAKVLRIYENKGNIDNPQKGNLIQTLDANIIRKSLILKTLPKTIPQIQVTAKTLEESLLNEGIFYPLFYSKGDNILPFIPASVIPKLDGFYTVKSGELLLLGYYNKVVYIYSAGKKILERIKDIENSGKAGLVEAVIGKENINKEYIHIGEGVYVREFKEGSKIIRDYIKQIGDKFYRIYLSKPMKTKWDKGMSGLGVVVPALEMISTSDINRQFRIYTAEELLGDIRVSTEQSPDGTIVVYIDGNKYILEVGDAIKNRENEINKSNAAGLVPAFIGGKGLEKYRDLGDGVYRREIIKDGKVVYEYIKMINGIHYRVYLSKHIKSVYNEAIKNYGVFISDLKYVNDPNATIYVFPAEELDNNKNLYSNLEIDKDGNYVRRDIYTLPTGEKVHLILEPGEYYKKIEETLEEHKDPVLTRIRVIWGGNRDKETLNKHKLEIINGKVSMLIYNNSAAKNLVRKVVGSDGRERDIPVGWGLLVPTKVEFGEVKEIEEITEENIENLVKNKGLRGSRVEKVASDVEGTYYPDYNIFYTDENGEEYIYLPGIETYRELHKFLKRPIIIGITKNPLNKVPGKSGDFLKELIYSPIYKKQIDDLKKVETILGTQPTPLWKIIPTAIIIPTLLIFISFFLVVVPVIGIFSIGIVWSLRKLLYTVVDLNKLINKRSLRISSEIPKEPLQPYTTQGYRETELRLGTLSIVTELVRYLADLYNQGKITNDDLEKHYKFWSELLCHQQVKLNQYRAEKIKITKENRRYALQVYDLNSFFRYCREKGIDPLTMIKIKENGQERTLKDIISDVENAVFGKNEPQKGFPFISIYSERGLFLQKIADEIEKVITEHRIRENTERKNEGLPEIPVIEPYPVNHFSFFFKILPKMLWTIFTTPYKGTITDNLKEASKFFKLIFLQTAIYNAIYLYFLVLGFINLPFYIALAGLIPGIFFVVLNFWAISYLNYAAMISLGRKHLQLDNVREWKDTQKIFKHLQNLAPNTGLGKTFRIFYSDFIDNLYNSDDQPGRGPLISREEYDTLKRALENGSLIQPISYEAQLAIKRFLNKWWIVYKDYESDVSKFDEFLEEIKNNSEYCLNIYHSGFMELVWVKFEELDVLQEDQFGKEYITKFRKVLNVFGKEWELFVEKLFLDKGIEFTQKDKDFLYSKNKDLTAVDAAFYLSKRLGIHFDDVKNTIEKWFAWRLENAGKTALGTYFSYLQIFKSWAKTIGIETEQEQEKWAKQRFRVIFQYSTFNDSWQRVNKLYGNFIKVSKQTYKDRIEEYKYWEGNPEQIPNFIFIEGKLRAHASKVGAWGERLTYLNLPFKITTSDNKEHTVVSDIAYFLDIGHRLNYDSVIFTPLILKDFFRNERLAMVSPVYYAYYEDYTRISRALSIGHEVWDRNIRGLKDYIDSENDFGKKFARVSVFKASRAFVPEHNSEDTSGGDNILMNGYDIRHTEIVDLPQSVEKIHFLGRSFVLRFGSTVPEIMFARNFWEFLGSPFVHWTTKFGTIFSFSHYIRIFIGGSALFIAIPVIFGLVLPPSFSLIFPLIFAPIGLIFSAAINAQTLYFYFARYGSIKGFLKFIKDAPSLFFTYVNYEMGNVFQFFNGLKGLGQFTLSPRVSNLVKISFQRIIKEPTVYKTLIPGVIFLTLLFLFPPTNLIGLLINSIYLITIISWVFVPFKDLRLNFLEKLRDIGKKGYNVKVILKKNNVIYHNFETKIVGRTKKEAAQHLLTEIYNRMTIFGADEVLVDVDKEIYSEMMSLYLTPIESRGYKELGNFMKIVYEKDIPTIFKRISKKEYKSELKSTPKYKPQKQQRVEQLKGKYIGIDIGGSDVKAVIFEDGKVIAQRKVNWTPKNFTSAEDHYQIMVNLVKELLKEHNWDINDVKGIGVSVNLAVYNNKVTGRGPLVEGIMNKPDELEKIKNLAEELPKRLNVNIPVKVLNDGDAAALYLATKKNTPNSLALSMGTGLAGGYVNENLTISDYLGEFGNIIIDTSKDAFKHSFSKVPGAAQQYLSQRFLFNLVEEWNKNNHDKKIDLSQFATDAEKLQHLQQLFDQNDERVIKMFEKQAEFIAKFIIEISKIIKVNNVFLSGRVVKGKSGEYMINKLKEYLNSSGYGNIKIFLPEDVEFAQAEAAIYFVAQHLPQQIGGDEQIDTTKVEFGKTQQETENPLKVLIITNPDGLLYPYSHFHKTKLDTKDPIFREFLEFLKNNQIIIFTTHNYGDTSEQDIKTKLVDLIPNEYRKNLVILASAGLMKIRFDEKGNEIYEVDDKHIIPDDVVNELKESIEQEIDKYWEEYERNAAEFREEYPSFIFQRPEIKLIKDNKGKILAIEISILPSKEIEAVNLPKGEEDVRTKFVKFIRKKLLEDIYAKRGLNLKCVRVGRTTIRITPEYNTNFQINGYLEDLKNNWIIDNVESQVKLITTEEGFDPGLVENTISPKFISAGEKIGFKNLLINGLGSMYIMLHLLNSGQMIPKIETPNIVKAVIRYLNDKYNIEKLNYNEKINVLWEVYHRFGLNNINDPIWTMIYLGLLEKELDLTVKELLERSINEYKKVDSIDKYYKKLDEIVSREDKTNPDIFEKFYSGLEPRIARNLSFYKNVYENQGRTFKELINDLISESDQTQIPIGRILSGWLQDGFYFKYKKLVSKTEQKRGPPNLVYIGGGGKATTTLVQHMKKKGSPINLIASSSDDGGHSWVVMEALMKRWGFYFFPPGDLAGLIIRASGNDWKVISGFSDYSACNDLLKEDINKSLNFGRITTEPSKNLLNIIERRIAEIIKLWKDPKRREEVLTNHDADINDMFAFLSSILGVADIIDRELIDKEVFDKLEKASLPNLILTAAAIDAGIIAKWKKIEFGPLENLNKIFNLDIEKILPVSTDYERSALVAEYEGSEILDRIKEIEYFELDAEKVLVKWKDKKDKEDVSEEIVLSQTKITDKGHKKLIKRQIFMHRVGNKFYPLKKKPKPVNSAVDLIKQAEVILIGNGSLWTSLLPNLMYKEVAQALLEARKRGTKIVYIQKIKADLETSADVGVDDNGKLKIGKQLTLWQQLEAIRNQISQAIGREVQINEIISHVILPDLSINTIQELQNITLSQAESTELNELLRKGKAQISKYIKGVQPIFDPDEHRKIESMGIKIIKVPEEMINGIPKKEPAYNNEYLYKILEEIRNETKILEISAAPTITIKETGSRNKIDQLKEAIGKSKQEIPENNPYKEIGFDGEANRLGWVRRPVWDEIERYLREVNVTGMLEGKTNIVFIGMGGSINTVKAIKKLLGKKSKVNIYTFDSLDYKAANFIQTLKNKGELNKTLVISISKSATTKETLSLTELFKKEFGYSWQQHIMFMVDLENEGKLRQVGYDGVKVIPIQLDKKTDIGGRFTSPHTGIFWLPLYLGLGKDLDLLKQYYNLYANNIENLAKQVESVVNSTIDVDKFAIAVNNKKMKEALETWITQLFQESLGSKLEGFNPKTTVISESELSKIPEGFTPIKFDLPKKLPGELNTNIVRMMYLTYLSELYVAIYAGYKNINFVNQPAVENYKRKIKEIKDEKISLPAYNLEQLIEQIRNASEGKRFIEVVVYQSISEAERKRLKDVLQSVFPDKTILVFIGSDWNHHSYQAAVNNKNTLFVILTGNPEIEIKDELLKGNNDMLLRIAYATYLTLKDKSIIGYLSEKLGSVTPMKRLDLRNLVKLFNRIININSTIKNFANNTVSKLSWIEENAVELSGKTVVVVAGNITEDVLSRIQMYRSLGLKTIVITNQEELSQVQYLGSSRIIAEHKNKRDVYDVNIYDLEGVKVINIQRQGMEFTRVALSVILDLIDGDNGLLGRQLKGEYIPAMVDMADEIGLLSYYGLLNDVYSKDYNVLFNKLVWMYVGKKENLQLKGIEEGVAVSNLYIKEGKLDLSRVYDYAGILRITQEGLLKEGMKNYILTQILPVYRSKLELAGEEMKWFSSETVKLLRTALLISVSLKKIEPTKNVTKENMSSIIELYKNCTIKGMSGLVLTEVSDLSREELKDLIKKLRSTKIKGLDIGGKLVLRFTKQDIEKFKIEGLIEISKMVDAVVIDWEVLETVGINEILKLRTYNRDIEIVLRSVPETEISTLEEAGIKIAEPVDEKLYTQTISRDKWYEIPTTYIEDTKRLKDNTVRLIMTGVDTVVFPQVNSTIGDIKATTFDKLYSSIEDVVGYILNITKQTLDSAYTEGYCIGNSVGKSLDKLGIERKNEVITKLLSTSFWQVIEEFQKIVNGSKQEVDIDVVNRYLSDIEEVREEIPVYVQEITRLTDLMKEAKQEQKVLLLAKIYGMMEGLSANMLVIRRYEGIRYKDQRILARMLMLLEKYVVRDTDGNITDVKNIQGIDRLLLMNNLIRFYPEKTTTQLKEKLGKEIEQLIKQPTTDIYYQFILAGIIGEQMLTEKFKKFVEDILDKNEQQLQDLRLKVLHYYASVMNNIQPKVIIEDGVLSVYGIETEESKIDIWLKLLVTKTKEKEFKRTKINTQQVITDISIKINPIVDLLDRKYLLSDKINKQTQKFEKLNTDPKVISDTLILFDLLLQSEYMSITEQKSPSIISIEQIKNILGAG